MKYRPDPSEKLVPLNKNKTCHRGGRRENDQTSKRHGGRRNSKKRQPESIRRSGQRRRADVWGVVSREEAA